MKKKMAKKSAPKVVDVLGKIYEALDDLGLRNRSPQGVPGTTEKIAMELAEIKTALNRIADSLENMNAEL